MRDFQCSMSEEDCVLLKRDIEETLFFKFMMKYNGQHFDHPAAYRMLEGLI